MCQEQFGPGCIRFRSVMSGTRSLIRPVGTKPMGRARKKTCRGNDNRCADGRGLPAEISPYWRRSQALIGLLVRPDSGCPDDLRYYTQLLVAYPSTPRREATRARADAAPSNPAGRPRCRARPHPPRRRSAPRAPREVWSPTPARSGDGCRHVGPARRTARPRRRRRCGPASRQQHRARSSRWSLGGTPGRADRRHVARVRAAAATEHGHCR